MTPLPEALEQLRQKNPGALALAERAALAAWVEPELLRALRLETLPGVGVAAEADLWFSELVSARSSSALVLRAEYLEPLREWGRTAPGELRRPVEVIRRMHAGSSELIRREERIIAGSLTGTLSPEEIQQQLFEVLATLLEDPSPSRRDAIASWALGAWPRLPREVRHSSAGLQLLVAANQRRGGYLAGPSIELPDETLEGFYAGLLGTQVRAAHVEVAWLGEELVLRQVQEASPVTVEVPGTTPIVLEIDFAQRRSLVLLRAQEPAKVKVEGDALTLRTMDGRAYRVARTRSESALEAQETAPGPWHWSRKWISVVGTGLKDLPEKVGRIAAELGKGLAREGHGLVVGGWPGVDELVGDSYTEELLRLGGDPRVFLERDLTETSVAPEGSTGRRHRHPHFREHALQGDALVLLGGDEGVFSSFLAARDMGWPVLPLPSTGGAAARAFESLLKSAELQRLDVPLGSPEEIQRASALVLELLQHVPGRVEPYARALLLIMASVWRARPEDDPAPTVLFQKLVRQIGLPPPTSDEVPQLFESLLMTEARDRALEVALARLAESLPAMKARLLHDFQELTVLGGFGLRIHARLSRLVVESSGSAGVEAVERVAAHYAFDHPSLLMLVEGARGGFDSEEQFRAWVSRTVGVSWTDLSFRALIDELAAGSDLGASMEGIREYYRTNGGRPAPDHVRYFLTIQLPPNYRALAYFVAREFHLVELRDQLFALLPFEQNEFLSRSSSQPLELLLDALQALGAEEQLRDPADGRRGALQDLLEALIRDPARDPDGRIRARCIRLLGAGRGEQGRGMTLVDIGIIIAFPDELRTFAELIPIRPAAHPGAGGGDFIFQIADGRYQGAVTAVNKMGEAAAALTSERFIQRWNPQLTVLLGLAIGIDPNLRVGDVVVANRVFRGMESVKNVSDQAPAMSWGGTVYQADSRLIASARSFEASHPALFERWRSECGKNLFEFPLEPKNREALIQEGIIREMPEFQDISLLSTGGIVGRDFSRLVGTMRNIGAVDMELEGLMAAAASHRPEATRTLILRGISDYGDGRKQRLGALDASRLRTYAMRNAIALLFALLQADLLGPADPEEHKKA